LIRNGLTKEVVNLRVKRREITKVRAKSRKGKEENIDGPLKERTCVLMILELQWLM
jgi:hypothetical protein